MRFALNEMLSATEKAPCPILPNGIEDMTQADACLNGVCPHPKVNPWYHNYRTILRIPISALLFVLALPCAVYAGDNDDSYNSSEYLEHDFKQASLVEVIHPVTVSRDPNIKTIGHAFLTTSRVVESFKGNLHVGESLEFYTIFEDKPGEFHTKEDRIVFLKRVHDKAHNRPVLIEIENSSREATAANLAKMRKIAYGPTD